LDQHILNITSSDLRFQLALLIMFLPMITFGVLFLFGKRIMPRKGDWFAVGNMTLVFLVSVILTVIVWSGEPVSYLYKSHWFSLPIGFSAQAPDKLLHFTFSLLIDRFSTLMLSTVSLVSLMVHIYSVDYMKVRKNYIRYFPYLALFTVAMNGIVLSDNLLITFMFWELVGFSSYLLIGFWFDKDSAVRASKKAFLVNRIGDAGFLMGIFALIVVFSSSDLSTIHNKIAADANLISYNHTLMILAGAGVLLGCLGKSAQFPFQLWLPDAMEGPTPVSALLHAATMVAAGAYLLAKVSFFFPPEILLITASVGALTALMGALPALVQNDIKKVLAYSTISQLGYMVMAIGAGAILEARFHLITHAFFKSCLFLTAGAVIHTLHHLKHDLFVRGYYEDYDTLDMRLMGGLAKIIPFTFVAYLISCLALVGIPFFSGFLSKEAVLTGTLTWAQHYVEAGGSTLVYLIPVSGFLTVLLTAAYMIRQLLLVFIGDFRLGQRWKTAAELIKDQHEHHWLLRGPMLLLAGLSLFAFFSFNPFSFESSWLLKGIGFTTSHEGHNIVLLLSLALVVTGSGLSWLSYKKNIALVPAGKFNEWLLNNYYLDEVYKKVLLYPGLKLSSYVIKTDQQIIDGLIHLKAYSVVTLGHLIAWFDNVMIDGTVNLFARSFSWIGGLLIGGNKGRVQSYMSFSVVFLLVLLFTLIYMFN
jgi:NADH-quinone oxidoreductase subunit L